MKNVKIDKVLAFVSPSVRTEVSDMDLMFYANNAFKSLDSRSDYEIVCCILPIKEHQVKLPEDLKSIERIYYTDKLDPNFPCEYKIKCKCGEELCDNVITEDQYTYCGGCNLEVKTESGFSTRENKICRHTLAYQVFLNFLECEESNVPLQYVGTTRDLVAKQCMNSCEETFSSNTLGTVLNLDRKSGWVSIVYKATLKDGNDTLIPDDTKLLRGLALFATGMYYEDKIGMNPNNLQVSMNFLQRAETLLLSYRSNKIMSKIKISDIDSIVGRNTNAQRALKYGHSVYKRNN